MKKIFYTFLSCLIIICLVGCSSKSSIAGLEPVTIHTEGYVEIIPEEIIEDNITLEEVYVPVEEEIIIEENVIEEEIVQNDEVTISFAGDFTLGTYKGQGMGGRFNDYWDDYGEQYFLCNVKEIFENDDFTFINLEGPLTNHVQTVSKEFPIKGEVEFASLLKNNSIEVCNLSNNHIYDCGIDGYSETMAVLSENNIGYCGEGNVYCVQSNGFNISFLGYTGWSDTPELRDKISKDILSEKESGSDIVCVMFHYGIERDNYSNSTQEGLSRHAIDSGADIVIGHHPHVIQGIEKYKGKVICYSLGNFCFGANKNPADKDTFIFQQTFKRDEDGNIIYGDSNVIPCSISSESNKNNYQPTPLEGDDRERVINRLIKYSSIYDETIFNEKY